ncbi:unnamed protein product [Psylliodes chrysocephalus]|uniref:Lipoprotein n=1 Tax=Psylliodes chrysocephalus TaxID=3402493 RepID=A0A9P0CH55_9CUCU|nr:unnamed protein product [Psylliodes chrysocephala]
MKLTYKIFPSTIIHTKLFYPLALFFFLQSCIFLDEVDYLSKISPV